MKQFLIPLSAILDSILALALTAVTAWAGWIYAPAIANVLIDWGLFTDVMKISPVAGHDLLEVMTDLFKRAAVSMLTCIPLMVLIGGLAWSKTWILSPVTKVES